MLHSQLTTSVLSTSFREGLAMANAANTKAGRRAGSNPSPTAPTLSYLLLLN